MSLCPFCDIWERRAPATILRHWGDTMAIVPLNPVVEGHTLVIPRMHVESFSHSPHVSSVTMSRAAEYADTMPGDVNLITSRGRSATQSVFHMHLHIIPRKENYGLALPWYSGRSAKARLSEPADSKSHFTHATDGGCPHVDETGLRCSLHLGHVPTEGNSHA